MPDHLLDRTVSRRSLIRRAVALGAAVTALPLLQACSAPAAAPAAAPTVPAGVAPTAVAAANAASTQVAAVAPTIAAAGNAAATQVSAAVPTAMAAATTAAMAPTAAAAPTTAATTAPAPTVAPTAAAAPTTAATTGPAIAGKKIKIGFALQSLAQYRWKFDQQYIEARVAELGDEVVVQSANDDEKLQASQVENLLSQGIQVLILAPVNVDASASLVDAAAEANVPTISYNYVARNTDKLAYWVARDNKLVGHITAELALKQAPKGNYVICSGDAGADVAQDKTKGYMETLQPSIDKGDIKVVSQQYNRGWDPALGLKQVEDALTANNNEIAAVLCNYDGFALSALQALREQKLEGKVFVGGEDVFPEGAQAIVEGRMAMSAYTDLKQMATKAVDAAHALGNGQQPAAEATQNNGKKDIPGALISSYAVTKDTMCKFISETAWVDFEKTYVNVPADQRPKC